MRPLQVGLLQSELCRKYPHALISSVGLLDEYSLSEKEFREWITKNKNVQGSSNAVLHIFIK